MGQLSGKAAVVTGGASGIGEACAETLAREGASVLVSDIDDALGKAVVERIAKAGGKAHYVRHDVRDEAAWPGVIGDAETRFGRLDIMVANAGIGIMSPIAEMTFADWQRQQAINLDGVFLSIKHAIPAMKKAGGGSIVNFSSVSYHTMTADLAVYQAAKAAVIGMTRGLARDLGPDKIRLNTITPGWIMTQRQIDLWLTPQAEAGLMEAQCLKEKLYPPDIARMALWLGADDSRLVTAQNFIVDGGRT